MCMLFQKALRSEDNERETYRLLVALSANKECKATTTAHLEESLRPYLFWRFAGFSL